MSYFLSFTTDEGSISIDVDSIAAFSYDDMVQGTTVYISGGGKFKVLDSPEAVRNRLAFRTKGVQDGTK